MWGKVEKIPRFEAKIPCHMGRHEVDKINYQNSKSRRFREIRCREHSNSRSLRYSDNDAVMVDTPNINYGSQNSVPLRKKHLLYLPTVPIFQSVRYSKGPTCTHFPRRSLPRVVPVDRPTGTCTCRSYSKTPHAFFHPDWLHFVALFFCFWLSGTESTTSNKNRSDRNPS
jgi:hypothetical protein